MRYAIPAPAVTTLPVDGSQAVFPVLRVFCVGRNYAEHAVEMGHDPDREPPFFFMKPAIAVVSSGTTLPFPSVTEEGQVRSRRFFEACHRFDEETMPFFRGEPSCGHDESRVFRHAQFLT